MAAANFQRALKATLAHEGGFANHPRDPGGVTLEGIIQRVYDGYRRRKGLPVRALAPGIRFTPEWIAERDDIYRTQYWNACRCDELPAGIDLAVFDAAVSSGPYQSALWLQRALGVNADGHVGANTLAMAAAHPDHDAVVADMIARRLGMLRNLKTWDTFGHGWTRRCASVMAMAQAWAMGNVGPAPLELGAPAETPGKGYASDVSQPPVSEDVGKGATAGGATIATSLEVAKETVAPYIYVSTWAQRLYLGLTILCIAVAVGGALYVWWAARRNKRARAAIEGNAVASLDDLDALLNGARA